MVLMREGLHEAGQEDIPDIYEYRIVRRNV